MKHIGKTKQKLNDLSLVKLHKVFRLMFDIRLAAIHFISGSIVSGPDRLPNEVSTSADKVLQRFKY